MQTHVVTIGDTWWKIAKTYNVSLPDLLALNGRAEKNQGLIIGEKVQIPSQEFGLEEKNEPDKTKGTALTPPVFSKADSWGNLGTYVTQPGDTWATIAEHFYLTIGHIKAANPHLLDMTWLPAGQLINIPSIGVILQEHQQKKQQSQSQQHAHLQQTHLHPPGYAKMQMKPQSFYPYYPNWAYPYSIYRCNCDYCKSRQDIPEQNDDEAFESSGSPESSSFWGSSSYFESSSMVMESSSSGFQAGGEGN
ncbi:LysM peptidoglycan-binding domain-containing protein [Fodinisporobacter ferrooxydans]|uniref:LysM peptidoglycan-binding domain-containing protein n=1 Tax=Fodinisporobacter ferrooxydans TaxID=2901836 RepID=A0ABY4CQX1_9BACL|nr:LysM peptidoglycan-binding domain-containing protein [Alicyclobacillaceae bacterium MYW30-H2]